VWVDLLNLCPRVLRVDELAQRACFCGTQSCDLPIKKRGIVSFGISRLLNDSRPISRSPLRNESGVKDTRCKWSQLYSSRYIPLIVTRFLVHIVVVKATGFLAGKCQISAVVRCECQVVGVRADDQIGKRQPAICMAICMLGSGCMDRSARRTLAKRAMLELFSQGSLYVSPLTTSS